MTDEPTQLAKFKEVARELETDHDAERFKERSEGSLGPSRGVA